VAIRRRGTQARRQSTRRAAASDVPDLPEVAHQPFEDLVAHALDGLPPFAHKLLENVAVVIDDEPDREQLRDSGLEKGDVLYGLYEGVSAATYAADYFQFPNKITIFRLPLEEDFPDPVDLAREVQRTVLHELGHHAGISDEHFEDIGFS
jgi:predicted Zn-dependent protease with MMP-like domain